MKNVLSLTAPIVVVLFYMVGNWWAVYVADQAASPLVRAAIAGVFLAQLLLVGAWGAVGPGGVILGHAIALGAALVLFHTAFVAYVVQLRHVFAPDLVDEYCRSISVLPLLLVAVHIPLWVVRSLTRWRLEGGGWGVDRGPTRVRHIMSATAYVAVALALVRAWQLMEKDDSFSEMWPKLAVVACIAVACGLFGAVPALHVVFRIRWRFYPLSLLAIVIYVQCPTMLSVTAYSYFGAGELVNFEQLLFAGVVGLAATVGVVVPLTALRCTGWRLERGRPSEAMPGKYPRRALRRRVVRRLTVTLAVSLAAYAVYAWSPWLAPLRDCVVLVRLSGHAEFENRRVVSLFLSADDPAIDLGLVARLERLQRLDLLGTEVADIRPLSRLILLEELDITVTDVNNLAPIRGLVNLRSLRAHGTRVSDLSGLSELKFLTELDISATGVTDLGPLRKLDQLKFLSISGTRVTDATPLNGLRVETLHASESDLTQLPILPHLRTLDISFTNVTSLAPLKESSKLENLTGLARWRHLTSELSQLDDLSPLSGLTSLTYLYLNGTSIKDLSPMAGLMQLRQMSVSGPLDDLSPLADLPLLALDVSDTRVRDLAPIRGMSQLVELGLDRTPVSDLSPLASRANLSRLSICHTQVTDLSPLAHCKNLSLFECDGTGVLDLSPIRGLTSMRQLSVSGTPVSDLTPLAKLARLEYLSLESTAVSSLAPIDRLRSLEAVWMHDTPVSAAEIKRFTAVNGAAVFLLPSRLKDDE